MVDRVVFNVSTISFAVFYPLAAGTKLWGTGWNLGVHHTLLNHKQKQ